MNEQNKLLEKYGDEVEPGKFNLTKENDKKRKKDLNDLLAMEIEPKEIPVLGLNENDFMDENCQYPRDKILWLNASEISTILAFGEKLKEDG